MQLTIKTKLTCFEVWNNGGRGKQITDGDATNTMQEMEKNECNWSESEIFLVMIVTQL